MVVFPNFLILLKLLIIHVFFKILNSFTRCYEKLQLHQTKLFSRKFSQNIASICKFLE